MKIALRDEREFKQHTGLTTLYSTLGRTLVRLTCPWCGDDVVAYLWSLAGFGKRCECGAVCGRFGAWKTSAAPQP
jgi:hypothetical protein